MDKTLSNIASSDRDFYLGGRSAPNHGRAGLFRRRSVVAALVAAVAILPIATSLPSRAATKPEQSQILKVAKFFERTDRRMRASGNTTADGNGVCPLGYDAVSRIENPSSWTLGIGFVECYPNSSDLQDDEFVRIARVGVGPSTRSSELVSRFLKIVGYSTKVKQEVVYDSGSLTLACRVALQAAENVTTPAGIEVCKGSWTTKKIIVVFSFRGHIALSDAKRIITQVTTSVANLNPNGDLSGDID